MTDPHGDGEPGRVPPGRPGEPPAPAPGQQPPSTGAAWGQQPWGAPPGSPPPGSPPPGFLPPHGATQPYGDFPATFGPPGQVPRPPWGPPPGDLRQPGQVPPGPGGAHGYPGPGAPFPGGPPPAGWGPPPRRDRHVGLVAGLAAVAMAAVAGGALLAASTGPTVLASDAVERDVAEQFEQREGVALDLRCAEEMRVEEGATYECSGITADDEQVTLRIEITDEDGARYTWTEP